MTAEANTITTDLYFQQIAAPFVERSSSNAFSNALCSSSILAKIKGHKLGPGLFAQIFKYLVSFATQHRLESFETNSCIYTAPKVSAICMQVFLVPSVRMKSHSLLSEHVHKPFLNDIDVIHLEQDAIPNLNLHKHSRGCNTRYAANNPFDAKVLKALTPNTSLDESQEEQKEDSEADVDSCLLPTVIETVRVSTPGSMTGTRPRTCN